ncbi:cold-shock protein [Brevibacillus sp. BC25]|uniref:cold-shock protein n=1 Tax=Brevibacillus sp. BC25 TaxID=1144308 RepID=UPI000270DD62|nr:cold shock domain-containing protein [Brevibacillus sp. BC25]EJL31787.1 cold shock protein [Brevibacillus sp. BC25]
MKQQVVERAPSFNDRAGKKIRVSTWEQTDPFPWIASTGFKSPRYEPKPQPAGGQRCGGVKWYSDTKGFGFSECGIFVHARNVVSGELRVGSRICFDVADGPKGQHATNVRVIG